MHPESHPTLPLRIAINGYGRIGRSLLRALSERAESWVKVVLINEPADLDSMVYLTRFDSTHGRHTGNILGKKGFLHIDDQMIAVTHERVPDAVAWRDHAVDLLIECSGQYGTKAELERFITAGCPQVLLSQPGHSAEDVDITVVQGFNHQKLKGDEKIISAASCTTHAAVPLLALLDEAFHIDEVLITTLHSVMNDQPLLDGYHHHDLRRTRSAIPSIIPVSTGLARGIVRLLPTLEGKVHAKAIRVPTLNVSALDITVQSKKPISIDAVNLLLYQAAKDNPALSLTNEAHASIDFNHDPHAAIVDLSQTRQGGSYLINFFVWFDNEWGFVNQMIDIALRLHALRSTRSRAEEFAKKPAPCAGTLPKE